MKFEPRQILLKNGKTALLRSVCPEDSEMMLEYLKATAGETPFLMRTPEECDLTLEEERAFLQSRADSLDDLHLVCLVEGRMAGSCHISRKSHVKNRHRAMIGIALYKAFWGLGIGTAMMEILLETGRRMGLCQVELEVFSSNTRANALYEKMGFVQTGAIPDAIRLPDGQSLSEIYMVKRLT